MSVFGTKKNTTPIGVVFRIGILNPNARVSHIKFLAFVLFARSGVRRVAALAGFIIIRFSQHKKEHHRDCGGVLFCGGERGIRTLGTGLPHTRFPVVRLRPAQPSLRVTRISYHNLATLSSIFFSFFKTFFKKIESTPPLSAPHPSPLLPHRGRAFRRKKRLSRAFGRTKIRFSVNIFSKSPIQKSFSML